MPWNKRVWRTSGSPEPAAEPVAALYNWHCQLIYLEVTPTAFVLDLIALEPCPVPGVDVDTGLPFTMQIGCERSQLSGALTTSEVCRWAAAADVITIRGGSTSRSTWMCLTAGAHDLVVEVAHGAVDG